MYGRELDGQNLTLSASGWTYDNTFVLYDYETETMWFHQGEELIGIGGPNAGRRLPTVPSVSESFSEFSERHPNTSFLDND